MSNYFPSFYFTLLDKSSIVKLMIRLVGGWKEILSFNNMKEDKHPQTNNQNNNQATQHRPSITNSTTCNLYLIFSKGFVLFFSLDNTTAKLNNIENDSISLHPISNGWNPNRASFPRHDPTNRLRSFLGTRMRIFESSRRCVHRKHRCRLQPSGPLRFLPAHHGDPDGWRAWQWREWEWEYDLSL